MTVRLIYMLHLSGCSGEKMCPSSSLLQVSRFPGRWNLFPQNIRSGFSLDFIAFISISWHNLKAKMRNILLYVLQYFNNYRVPNCWSGEGPETIIRTNFLYLKLSILARPFYSIFAKFGHVFPYFFGDNYKSIGNFLEFSPCMLWAMQKIDTNGLGKWQYFCLRKCSDVIARTLTLEAMDTKSPHFCAPLRNSCTLCFMAPAIFVHHIWLTSYCAFKAYIVYVKTKLQSYFTQKK